MLLAHGESRRGRENKFRKVKAMLSVREGSWKGRRQFAVTAGRHVFGSHLQLAEDPPVCAALLFLPLRWRIPVCFSLGSEDVSTLGSRD